MVDKTLTEVRTDNPAVAPTGAEPIETVQSATSAAFVLAELANSPLNAQTGTTYTLAVTDQSKVVTMSNVAANTCTIPLNATVAFHIGAKLLVRQIGAGLTTLAATGGVTIEKATDTSLTLAGAQEQLVLHKTAIDTWHVAPMNPSAGGGGGSFHGVLLEKDATQARTNSIVTNDFDTEVYDTDSFADLGTNDDRITIPTGVTKVQVTASISSQGDVSDGDGRFIIIRHRDSVDATIRQYTIATQGGYTDFQLITCTPIFVVTAGDYIEMRTGSEDSSWTQEYVSLCVEYKDGTL